MGPYFMWSCHMFSIMAAPTYTPLHCLQEFPSFESSPTFVIFFFVLMIAILIGAKSCLTAFDLHLSVN